MKNAIHSLIGGLITISVILYVIFKGGGQIDPKKLDQIRKSVKKKPIKDVVSDINGWLS